MTYVRLTLSIAGSHDPGQGLSPVIRLVLPSHNLQSEDLDELEKRVISTVQGAFREFKSRSMADNSIKKIPKYN